MTMLRILSLNLLIDRADPGDLRRLLADTDPDVVCVQELGRSAAAVLEDVLPHGRLDPRTDLFGLGIVARHQITVDRVVLERRSGWVARLETDDWPRISSPLDVFNVHLINPIDRPWRESRSVRRKQVAQLTSAVVARDVPAVVIGDMNATPVWREYKMLSELGADAARATGTARRTWSHFLAGPRLLRIDHAFVRGARPEATSTVRVRGSDHSALIVDIEV